MKYRFLNLFGKRCRPNYNSAVATFCNNARKLVTVFPTKMVRQDFEEKITPILMQDGDVEETAIKNCKEHLWRKYDFASSYYNTQEQLLVSITYRDGETKDYSFHSLEYLVGIVRFKNVT